jgi:hypothetical protein
MVFFVSMIKNTNNPITINNNTTTTANGTIGLTVACVPLALCSASHTPSIYISVRISRETACLVRSERSEGKEL